MTKNLKWKALLVTLVIGFALWMAYPPLDIRNEAGELIKEGKVGLGLDLQGGIYMVLRVDTSGITGEEAKQKTVDRALTTIRNRINKFGLKEPLITKTGTNRILIQLPGATNREEAIKVVKQVAHLEFRMVSGDIELRKKALDGEATEGYELLTVQDPDEREAPEYLVAKKAEMTGKHITRADVDFDQQSFGTPYVKFSLDKEGAVIFADVTKKHIGEQLAIVLDGTLISAPRIQSVIPGGEGRITGNFNGDVARNLAIVLESGALPAPIDIIEERTVGPTLGKDSIEKGIMAIIIGGLLVLGFMAIYYLIAGLVADFALMLNLILITAALSYSPLHATLTLPGIAGLVLTIGMAVDANVLIFERIREELKLGKSIRAAIQSGFSRAFLTIMDANITTFIAAFVLFQFGTGPVKGFATVLMIGIASSMFTALFVTRLILDLFTHGKSLKLKKLPMLSIVREPKIDFIGMRKIAYVLSAIAIIGGMFLFYQRGEGNYGIDFTGGTIEQVKFQNPVEADEARDAIKELGLGSASIQHFGNDKEIIIRSFEMDRGKTKRKVRRKPT